MLTVLTAYRNVFWQGTWETIYMTALSTVFAYLIGLPLGILLFISQSEGISPSKPFYFLFGWIVNIGRSIPFTVLLVAVVPLTRLIAGKIIGPTAAVVPLVVAAAPFVARLTESALAEVDPGVLQAAICMGADKKQIIFRVLLAEAVPALVRNFSLTCITLLGYSAMAGAVGGGGLGDIAVRYGLHRHEAGVMPVTLLLLIIMVCSIQIGFARFANHLDKK